jgi:hypothetical protein
MACRRPKNYKELFNLRHAQARNVVERIFGVVKRRFTLMVAAPEYSIRTQAKMIPAMCTLHNFIRIHDPTDLPGDREYLRKWRERSPPKDINPEELGGDISREEAR